MHKNTNYFIKFGKLILKLIWKIKHARIAKKTLKKENYKGDYLYQTLKHTKKHL